DWPLSQLMDKQEPAEGADAAESLAVDLRGNALDDDFMGSGSLAQDPEEGAIAIANAAESVLEDFSSLPASLLELIEQALEDARANQEEISPEFDGSGSGQAVVRDWIDSSLRDAAASAREFFQGEIRGEGREAIQTTVDALGSPLLSEAFEPLLAVDYYAAAADVINGLLDAVAQPIGSASLPRIGPLLDNPREELATYLG
ncbi:MAG TPA: hypothetical protein VFV39_01295, partial [Limnobacter sp.]|nr:hypothetical protein [Limnobacter sp.]